MTGVPTDVRKGDPCPRCTHVLHWIQADNGTYSLGCPQCGWPGVDLRALDVPDPEPEPVPLLPPDLWQQAAAAHPDDDDACRTAYTALMVDAGYLVLDTAGD